MTTTTDTSQADSVDPVKIPDSWFWIKGSNGNASVTTTFVTIAFVVTTFAYIASIFVKIGPVTFRSFDVAAASTYLLPLLTLYFGRRWTESKERTVTTQNSSGN